MFALFCLFSRSFALALGLFFYPRVAQARSARSSHVMQNVSVSLGGVCLLVGLLLGLLFISFLQQWGTVGVVSSTEMARLAANPFWPLFLLIFCLCLSALILYALIRRTEALNGDLLGATVCISEAILTICFFMIF